MGFFTKTGSKEKKEEKGKSAVSPSPNASGAGAESNPQEVGIVSGLVRDSKSKGSVVADGDIVTRRFGPPRTGPYLPRAAFNSRRRECRIGSV